jgi:hypothetical protein
MNAAASIIEFGTSLGAAAATCRHAIAAGNIKAGRHRFALI